MRQRSIGLKARLLLTMTLLTALLCFAAGLYIVARAQADIRGEVRAASDLVQRYVEARIELARAQYRDAPGRIPSLELSNLSGVRHVDVVLMDLQGTVAERSTDPSTHRHHAPDWFARLVDNAHALPPLRTVPLVLGGHTMGVVQIQPDASFELDEIWNVSRGLIALFFVFFAVVNLALWWAVGYAIRPLAQVRTALVEIGGGHLGARVAPIALPEFAGLGEDFNRMAAALEASTSQNACLTLRLMRLQEEERAGIARELHDEIGQYVTAIHADAAAIVRADAPARTADSAHAIIDATARIKTMLRGLLRRLRPMAVADLGLADALQELIAGFRQRNPQVACVSQIDPALLARQGDVAATLYRLVQESLTNIERHARARRVSIDVAVVDAEAGAGARVRLRVADDGDGFDPARPTPGFGLVSLRERASAAGGSLSVDSLPGAGTRIVAWLPLEAPREAAA